MGSVDLISTLIKPWIFKALEKTLADPLFHLFTFQGGEAIDLLADQSHCLVSPFGLERDVLSRVQTFCRYEVGCFSSAFSVLFDEETKLPPHAAQLNAGCVGTRPGRFRHY